MKPLKIVLTCNYSPWSAYCGGGQKSTHMLATALADLGHTVSVVYSKSPWEKMKQPTNIGYSIYWAFFFGIKPGISSPFRFLNGVSFWWTLRNLVPGTDVLLSNGEEGALFFLFKEKCSIFAYCRYPRFEKWLHNLNYSQKGYWLRVFLKEPRHAALANTFYQAHQVICTSKSSKNELTQVYPFLESKVTVIPNGIDPIFYSTEYSPHSARTNILFFGRLTKAKGVLLLLESFKDVLKDYPELILQIVGQGPLENQLKEAVAKHQLTSAVELIGWLPSERLLRYLDKARLVVLPSFEESFGNTHLEALAYGAPLITFESGSIGEVVRNYGKVLKERTQNALTQAIKEQLQKEVSVEEIQQRVQYVKKNFSWTSTARQLEKVIEAKKVF